MFKLTKQPMMRTVLYALVPVFLFSVYMYGWRPLVILVVSYIFGFLTEFLSEKIRHKEKAKVSEAVFVTCTLYALSLPPQLGDVNNLWITIIGIVFAILFAKEAYGGFGRNVYNPAIAGRIFIYLCFPKVVNGGWLTAGHWGTIDAVTTSTPMHDLKAIAATHVHGALSTGVNMHPASLDWYNLLMGQRAGSIGEGFIVLLVLCGIYLIATKTANWRLMVSPLIGAFALMVIFYYTGVTKAIDPYKGMFAGSLIFASVFMITEPVTAPKKALSQWIYGLLIGFVTVIIRTFAGYPEGISFAILFGNTFANFIDIIVGSQAKKKKNKSKPASSAVK